MFRVEDGKDQTCGANSLHQYHEVLDTVLTHKKRSGRHKQYRGSLQVEYELRQVCEKYPLCEEELMVQTLGLHKAPRPICRQEAIITGYSNVKVATT